jgi:hypothetical protein
MDQITFDEIISCLAKSGRPDLIMELRELENKIVDPDWEPPTFIAREKYSDEEGSAESEEVDFDVDDEGFHSLR